MKKYLLFIAVIAVIAGCSKQEANQEDLSKWNGYEDYYKAGEMYKDLKTRNGVVGTVTYGIDDNANFYVKYETSGDWELVKTSMYAGKWRHMPKRKKRRSKVYNFPHKTNHSPYVTTYTYTIPLTDLPPAESPGFIVAANARVYSPNKCGGGGYNYTYKDAWAEWDRRFSCRSYGGYSNYYYNQPYEPHTLLYGTEYRNDSLAMYLIDATDGTASLIDVEYVGTPPSASYDGTAYNTQSNQFFFTNYDLQELWVNNMDSTDSYKAGDLDGVAASATFYNNNFYYVDETNNEIIEVSLTGNDSVNIVSETVLSTIPESINVNDIAFEPNGDNIYVIGTYTDNNNVTTVELIELEVSTDTYSTINIAVAANAQIAYGDDEVLYLVETEGDEAIISSINPQNGIKTEINDDEVVIIDPFADLATGPIN